MVIDAHVHCTGRERAHEVIALLDAAEVDMAVLLAPFLSPGFSLDDAASLWHAAAHVARLAHASERIVGFAVINPLHDDALALARHAIEDLGLRGLKMVPAGWYPDDARAGEVFAYAAAAGVPVLFHCGIFIDGRSGRYCRPVLFEVVRDHPGLRVTLAHLGWPWCDEAIAVGLIDLINGVTADARQFRFDLSFGAPPAYRHEVLGKALAVLGADNLQFGSDCFLPCDAALLRARIAELQALLDALSVTPAARAAIMGGTAARWLRLTS